MAITFDYTAGVTMDAVVQSSVVSGNPVRIGSIMGVALTDAEQREDGNYYATVGIQGVLASVGTTHIASAAVNQGTAIYTSTAAGSANIGVAATLTTTSSGNTLFGYTLNTRSKNDGNLLIKLVG